MLVTEYGLARLGQVVDALGAGIIALGAVTVRNEEMARAAKPDLEEIASVEGLVLLRQDNAVGGGALAAGAALQLIGAHVRGGLALFLVGSLYMLVLAGAYWRARHAYAEGAVDRVRAIDRPSAAKQVNAKAIAMAIAMS